MVQLTPEAAYEDLQEVVEALVTKAQAGGASEGEALQIVADALLRLLGNTRARIPHWGSH